MNNYSEIIKVFRLRQVTFRQAMCFIYALCASMLCGVLPSIRFGLVSLRSLLLNVFWILEASRPNLSLMMSCAYSMLTALYCLAWDALLCLATSRPRLTLVLVLLRGQPHGFWAGFLVGCLVTAWPGLLCLLVKSLLACAIVHLALWLVPAFSEHTDTQGFSDPVILALRPVLERLLFFCRFANSACFLSNNSPSRSSRWRCSFSCVYPCHASYTHFGSRACALDFCTPAFPPDRFGILGLVRSPFHERKTFQVSGI